MEFENAFVVDAPIGKLWELLLDVERIAPCMPGAQVLEHDGDSYKVAVKVKLGPMSMLYKADVEIVDRDPVAHRATMRANAKESRGQGTAKADIVMSLSEEPAGTRALIRTDMKMSGKAAAMGHGVISDVAGALTDTFAANLAQLVEGPPPAEEAPVAQAPDETLRGSGPHSGPDPHSTADAEPATERPAPAPAPEAAEASLPIGKIVASVMSGRLQDPRTLGIAAGALAALCLVLGMAIGRRRAS